MDDAEVKVNEEGGKSSNRKRGVDAGGQAPTSLNKSKQGQRARTKPIQSHGDQPLYSQRDTLRMTKTKPRARSSMASMVYGHFDPVFSQVATDGATLYIADSAGPVLLGMETKRSQTKPLRLSCFE
ncbi:MAG: hypothetical protein ACLQOO_32235 [Terriglobia bacterium]